MRNNLNVLFSRDLSRTKMAIYATFLETYAGRQACDYYVIDIIVTSRCYCLLLYTATLLSAAPTVDGGLLESYAFDI